MTDAFIEWYGSEAADTILTALLPPALTVRVNRSRAERAGQSRLTYRGIEPHPRGSCREPIIWL